MNWMSRLAEPAYAAFRIVFGLLFAPHGAMKLFDKFASAEHPAAAFPSQIWFGGVIELVCGALIAIGFQTRCAAFLASGTMAVAYFQFHQPQGALPVQNGGEMAVLYCFAFLFIAAKGSGIWSVSGKDK